MFPSSVCSYLQWLIEEQDSDDTRIHTLYAISLAKSATEYYQMGDSSKTTDDSKVDEKHVSDSGSLFQSSARDRLQNFLQSSYLYDPIEVLDLIEGSDFWFEKVCGIFSIYLFPYVSFIDLFVLGTVIIGWFPYFIHWRFLYVKYVCYLIMYLFVLVIVLMELWLSSLLNL